ncbi:TelA-like protein [Brevundimonas phage vB_BpoS-Papperlapapp]|uniref:TelA-like protein n=1 Tax=Brevundimonas phage vB_BpoS-Domovoi TaxID=2948598 RepID=A0A9E7MQY3_9CAUD|nr:putative TelA-like protein [Brevundimonas phage vB_BpoS-Domovoi]USN16176.1 TelA-like protein [Brevundimonas phage vB_BpoS-Papperlapapp]
MTASKGFDKPVAQPVPQAVKDAAAATGWHAADTYEPRATGLNVAQGQPPAVRPAGVPAGRALTPFTLQEVVDYGKPQATAAATVASKITGSARSGDIDEVGKALTALLTGAQQYDPSKLGKGGFLGFFKRKKRELEAHYKSVDAQVNTLAADVQKHIGHFQGRIGDLEALKKENAARHTELGAAMERANERIAWMKANPPEVDATDPMSATNLQTWNNVIAYAEKRVDDLRRAQILCEMQAPQIDMMQQNAGMLVMKFGEVQTTTLPQLQMGFSLYIANMEAQKGAEFSKAIDNMNNDLITKNSAQLGATTVAVRQQMARSSVDLTTLQTVKDNLFTTMDECKRIQSELSTRLQNERPALEQASQDLAARLATGA